MRDSIDPATLGQSTDDQSTLDRSAVDLSALDQSALDQSALDQLALDQLVGATAGRIYCSDLARAAAAPLIGTAEPVDVWLLLEYAPTWRPRATDDNSLPAAVNAWLDAAVTRLAETLQCTARVQFIRQPGRSGPAPRFFIVESFETRPTIHGWTLARYEDLLSVDPVAVVRDGAGDGSESGGTLVDAPLYLVCTHGQRDLCCARFGLPVYERLAAQHGAAVWQTTHLGGHRYAPNLVCLPEGVVYGFAQPDIAPDLVAAVRQGEIVLDSLRGRSCFPPHVQVAELAARRRAGVTRIDGLRLSGDRQLSDDEWRVTFEIARHGRLALTVRRAPSIEVQASCGDGKTKQIEQFVIVDEARQA